MRTVFLKIEKILFYFLVFCLPFQARKVLWTFSHPFNEWASLFFYGTDILILAVLFLWILRGGLKEIRMDKIVFWSIFLLIAAGLSLIKSGAPTIGLYQLFKLLEFVLLFFYVQQSFKAVYSLKRIFQVLAVSGIFQAILAIFQFARQASPGLKILGESPLAPDLAGVAKFTADGIKFIRAYGTFPHPSILAAFLVLVLFGLMYLFQFVGFPNLFGGGPRLALHNNKLYAGQAEDSRKRSLILLFLGLLLLGLLLTFSRVIIIIGLLGIALYLLFVVKKRGLFFLSVGLCFLLVALLWSLFFARFSTDLAGTQAVDLRIFYSQAALEMFKSSPFLGIGWGSFAYRLSLVANRLEPWMYQPVHNIYLLAASQAGILGLLGFLGLLGVIIKRAVVYFGKTKDKEIVLLLFILGFFLIIGLFDHFLLTSQQGSLMLWLVLGMIAGYTR